MQFIFNNQFVLFSYVSDTMKQSFCTNAVTVWNKGEATQTNIFDNFSSLSSVFTFIMGTIAWLERIQQDFNVLFACTCSSSGTATTLSSPQRLSFDILEIMSQ